MARNMTLVAKGRRVTLRALMQQGRVSETMAVKFAAELAGAGFSEAHQQKLTATLALLDAHFARQSEKRAKSKANRVAEAKAIADAKAFKRRLDVAVADLYARAQYEDGFEMPVAREAFRVGNGRLKSSTPKILGYLSRVRPQVKKVNALLTPYFDGADALALLDAAASALKTADTVQEIERKEQPLETLNVQQLKGEVLFLIERLNRAGRAAFDGDPEKASLFNKSLLARGRRGGLEVIDGGAPTEVGN